MELLVFWCSSVVESLCAHVGGLGSILSQGRKPSRAGLIPGSGGNPRSRKWQPIRVFLSGKFPGQRNLGGCNPRGQKEPYASGQLSTTLSRKGFLHLLIRGACQKVGARSAVASVRKQGSNMTLYLSQSYPSERQTRDVWSCNWWEGQSLMELEKGVFGSSGVCTAAFLVCVLRPDFAVALGLVSPRQS